MNRRWMNGASRPFTKVLIANRGEIACRIIRACKEAGLSSLAIYAEDDAESLFVEMSDESVLLPGGDLASTYLNVELPLIVRVYGRGKILYYLIIE